MNQVPRPSFLEVAMSQICEEASRGTCRIQVGAGLWRADKSLASLAHNGSLPGEAHCEDASVGCLLVDGHCKRCDHAERNAERYAGVRELKGGYGLSTHEPCIDCFRGWVRLGVKYIGYLTSYGQKTEQEKKYIEHVCRQKNIIMEKFEPDILVVKNKILARQQGTGGILSARKKIVLRELNLD